MQKIDKYLYNRRKARVFVGWTCLELTYITSALIKVVMMTFFTLVLLDFDTFGEFQRP